MKYYQLLIFLCIIFCINSNFTTTKIIPLENYEPVSNKKKKSTKIIFNNQFNGTIYRRYKKDFK
jgi:hypothetical protein